MRKSTRARKAVQQMNLGPTASPRLAAKKELHSQSSDDAAADSKDTELDPFAPPPRLGRQRLQSSLQDRTPPRTLSSFPGSTGTQSASRPKSLPSYSGGVLFEQLNSGGIALKTLADDWLAMLDDPAQRKEDAALVLVNLVLWASRIENDIAPEHFVTESVSQILTELQENIEPTQSKTELPLFDKNRKTRVFRNQYSEFWTMWAASVLPAVDDMELIEQVLLPWLISMSSAGYRPMRYAATLAVLDIVHGCCRACAVMQKDLEKSSRILSAKRTLTAKRTVESASARIADIERIMQMAIDAVFVQRYRDVDPLIREKCVVRVLSWIVAYPDVFLDNAYLRYIGWSLSDKTAAVRLASLTGWKTVCSRAEFRPALANFVTRFKTRLFEVLTRDVDKSCRSLAGQVVDSLLAGSFITLDETAFLDDLIFSGDATVASLKECLSSRIFGSTHAVYRSAVSDSLHKKSEEAVSRGCIERFALFIAPFMNAEPSADANSLILRQLVLNMREPFPFLLDMAASTALITNLIAAQSEADASVDADADSEKISCLLALLHAQVQCVKGQKGTTGWGAEDSTRLFVFVGDFLKFINDNEREIYSKDIFYLFSLLNEVELATWTDMASVQALETLLPILTELFGSIDDLESAKAGLVFFKRARMVPSLRDRVLECFSAGKQRLLQDLLRRIPGNMREALKIKDSAIMTLILPLSQLNLLKSLEIEDTSVLVALLNMTKLVDEFVSIDEAHKTMIWTCAVRLVFHELMWRMMDCRAAPSDAAMADIVTLRDHLADLLSPADYLSDSPTAGDFERLCTCVNVLADLALLFSQTPVAAPIDWPIVLTGEQTEAIVRFVALATRIAAEPLPVREAESFELGRLAKKMYGGMIASVGKLLALNLLPDAHHSALFMTLGFVDDVSDAVVRVVLDRWMGAGRTGWNSQCPVIGAALQESYLMAVASSEYERLVTVSTGSLVKLFNDHLRQTPLTARDDNAMAQMHHAAIDFFQVDCGGRSEFLGRVMSQFSLHVAPKHCETLVGAMKAINHSDAHTRSYIRSLERGVSRGNVAQRLLNKRPNSIMSTPVPLKALRLEAVVEEEEGEEKGKGKGKEVRSFHTPTSVLADDNDDNDDEVEEMDTHTQLAGERLNTYNDSNVGLDQLPSSPPAILRRKVIRY